MCSESFMAQNMRVVEVILRVEPELSVKGSSWHQKNVQ